MILSSLKSGLTEAWSTKRLLLVLYLASLLPALALALPLHAVLMNFAGHSLMGSELVHGVTADFLAELVSANRAAVPTLTVILVSGSVAFSLLSLFLSGGAMAVLAGEERYRADAFWRGSATFFGRFLRLSLWSMLLLAALSLLPLGVRWARGLIFGSDPYQYVSFWGAWIFLGAAVMALFFFRICFDYARIHAVLTGEKRTRKSLWHGLRFVLGRPIRTGGLAVAIVLLGALALLAYLAISNALDGSTTRLVLAAILAQQLYVLSRVTLRVTRYGSQIALYRNLTGFPVGAALLSDGTADEGEGS